MIKLMDILKEIIVYLNSIPEMVKFKTETGYKIHLSKLDEMGFDRQQLYKIQRETKPFEGRLIIDNNICIIEHPNIYNKIY